MPEESTAVIATPPPAAKSFSQIFTDHTAKGPSVPTEPKAPEQKSAEKAVEKEPTDDDILNETPKGQIKHEHFERQRQAAKRKMDAIKADYEKKLADREEALKRVDGIDPSIKENYEKAQVKLTEYEKALEQASVEHRADFRREHEREQSIRRRMAETLKEYGADESLANAALAMSGKRRDALLEELELSPIANSRLSDLMNSFDEIQESKSSMRENAKELNAREEAQYKAQQERQAQWQQHKEKEAFDAVSKELISKFKLLQTVDGDAEHNARAEKLLKSSRDLFNGAPEDAPNDPDGHMRYLSRKAMMSELAEVFAADNATKDTKIAELEAELTKLKANGPEISSVHRNGRDSEDVSKMPMEQRLRRIYQKHTSG